MLEKQARRMLADPRAEALGSRFAAQWLRLQDVDKVHPDPNFYPDYDDNLAAAMRRETELFFNHLVREDRSLLELYRGGLHLRERAAGAALRHPERRPAASSAASSIRTTRAAACSARAACWCRPRSPTAPRRCCAASG